MQLSYESNSNYAIAARTASKLSPKEMYKLLSPENKQIVIAQIERLKAVQSGCQL